MGKFTELSRLYKHGWKLEGRNFSNETTKRFKTVDLTWINNFLHS